MSTENLLEAVYLFNEVTDNINNYFSANCFLEMGTNHLRLKDPPTATAFLYKAHESLEKCFGDDHPTI